MSENGASNSDYGPRLAFEAIGSSVWQALQRLAQGNLASLHLMLAYYEFSALPLSARLNPGNATASVFENYGRTDESGVDFMSRDRRRYTLLACIGILDSFLSDSLRFLFLHSPAEIPSNLSEKRESGEGEANFVERIVRRSRRFSSQRKRAEFLSTRFRSPLDKDLQSELEILTHLRNDLAHHPGLYRFNKNEQTGAIWAQPKPLPEVSQENATKIQVIVTEVCDSLLVAMCRGLFGDDPRVRPLTPAVAAVHQGFREQWAARKSAPPNIEEFMNTRWSVRVFQEPSGLWVEDHASSFTFMPTGIDVIPALISFRRNSCHGTVASVAIDGAECVELDSSRQIINQMLEGNSALVTFYDESADEPKYARFSLEGFAQAWETACRMQEEKPSSRGGQGGPAPAPDC